MTRSFLTAAAIVLAAVLMFLAQLTPSAFAAPAQAKASGNAGGKAEAPVVTVCITQPWLSAMARFIAGSAIKVQPISAWNKNGALRRTGRLADGAPVIALDPKDAASHSVRATSSNLRLLYDNFPVRDDRRGAVAFDPSALPFVSQRLLIVISNLDPDNYPFYQRRLAEFQSRLESSLEVGRSMISQIKLLDLSGCVGPWAAAAAKSSARPPRELWEAWAAGRRLGELSGAIDEASRRGLRILTDAWTPPQIQKAASERAIFIEAPEGTGYDFFEYLYNIYVTIWNASAK